MTSTTSESMDSEIGDKSAREEFEDQLQKKIIYDVPNEFVENFVLKKPGEFCISKSLDGHYYLSLFVDYNKKTKEEAHTVHLPVAVEDNKMLLKGWLFSRADTLGSLVYNLINKHLVDILAGVLEKKVKMEHLVDISAAELHNVHVKKEISDKKILEQTYRSVVYSGRIELSDGKTRECLFEETRNIEDKAEFLEKFFKTLVNGAEFTAQKLPIRAPIGAILEPPTLIYSQKHLDVGFSLETILKQHDGKLDLTQRIKLCGSAVRIMSELHHADIFHGAVHPENFYAEYVGMKDGVKQYELLFNGTDGLLRYEKSDNSVAILDYDLNAPELAFTRKLTKETGVFNMGRLFERILKTEIMKLYDKKPEDEPPVLHDMRRLIHVATRPNPERRPTMHGVVLIIREVLMQFNKSTATSTAAINFVHYDQFAD